MLKYKDITCLAVLLLAIVILFIANLVWGSVNIPLRDVCAILMGGDTDETWRYIVMESRMPQAITALLAGAALAVSGLLLQTAFRNPLAGPDVFGISSGAGLAVALVVLGMGGSVSTMGMSLTGFAAILVSALVGALAVTALIFFFSTLLRNHVMLLIVGIMIGYISSSAISLLNFLATDEGVKSYAIWGMGTFGHVTMEQIPFFAVVVILGLLLSLCLVKPLNALLLGEQYAENLGFPVRRLRHVLLLVTGLLTAVVTAFCGPVAFIGLATPHVVRLLFATDNHRILLPFTLLMGSIIALLCNLICYLPDDGGMIPLNAVTPLMGAPVIIYVILKRKG